MGQRGKRPASGFVRGKVVEKDDDACVEFRYHDLLDVGFKFTRSVARHMAQAAISMPSLVATERWFHLTALRIVSG